MACASSQSPILTLTTDFGTRDTYVGVMKGVLLGIVPEARLIDLTHEIAPQNIEEASARLEAAVDYFPPGVIHLVVVDPGVGSERAAIIVQTANALFVAPDNGVLTLPLQKRSAQRAVRLTEAAQPYCLQPISATFHGRDLFAPVAAHLASGVAMEAFGVLCDPATLVTLPCQEPQPERDGQGGWILRPRVLYADRFGNLVTNLTPYGWSAWQRLTGGTDDPVFAAQVCVQAGNHSWQGMARTFAEVGDGDPLAYWGSGGRLEIAIRNGNAARDLPLPAGALCLLRWR